MEPVVLHPNRTALVVIDITKGTLSFPGKPYPAKEVLAKVVRLFDAARKAGQFVVLVKVDSADGKDMLHPLVDVETPFPQHMPSDWAEFPPELDVQPSDHVITKHQWGAFFGTDLDLQLRRRGIDTMILCGGATNFGVETTAREAYQHGYQQLFVEDAMTALSEEEHDHSCKYILPRIGRLRSTEEISVAIGTA